MASQLQPLAACDRGVANYTPPLRNLNRRNQTLFITVAVLLFAAAASHFLIRWLRIDTTKVRSQELGPDHGHVVLVTGSSLPFYGLDWEALATGLDLRVRSCTSASGSACELEPPYRNLPNAEISVLSLSLYDLNEQVISDFRAELVPLRVMLQDLRKSRMDWAFTKRALSQYPLRYLRVLYPTAGRSLGVLVGLRARLRELIGPLSIGAEEGQVLGLGAGVPQNAEERVSEWPQARLLRNVSNMRKASHNRHVFGGPKYLAFARMVKHSEMHRKLVLLVMPVSPAYREALVDAQSTRRFEETVARLGAQAPDALLVRLDQLERLNTNSLYFDLTHLNTWGQAIATHEFTGQLRQVLAAR
jgi:hypothetical protein